MSLHQDEEVLITECSPLTSNLERSLYDMEAGPPSPGSVPDPMSLRKYLKSEEELVMMRQRRGGSKLESFYRDQNELIETLLAPVYPGVGLETEEQLFRLKVAVYGSTVANVIIFGMQLYAAIASGSLTLFATMAESFMDLLSTVILLLAGRAVHTENVIKYPTGKDRLETAGIIVFSSLMATVSIELMIESIKALIRKDHTEEIPMISLILVGIAFVTKGILLIYCYSLRRFPSAAILAQDHRNDVLVNGFGLIMALLVSHVAPWMDSVGAMIVALVILRSWTVTAYEQIDLLVGRTADPIFINKLIYLAVTHHPDIREVDTCRAYHSGEHLYVEVDVVMSPDTPLKESHDIAESLQMKMECLPNVSRAFVHVDYESEHAPEHRPVVRSS